MQLVPGLLQNPYTSEHWSLPAIEEYLAENIALYSGLSKSNKMTAQGRILRRKIKQLKEAIQLKK